MKHVILTRILVHLQGQAGAVPGDRHPCRHRALRPWRRRGRADAGMARRRRPARRALRARGRGADRAYRAILATVRERHGDAYPGSPLIMRELMRPQDRAVFVELHPEDEAVLARRFRRDAQVKVLHLDGWTALHALIPAKERRGLVLVDPPYEEPGELERLAREMAKAHAQMADRHLRRLVSDQGSARRRRPGRDHRRRRARQGVAPRAHDRRAHASPTASTAAGSSS